MGCVCIMARTGRKRQPRITLAQTAMNLGANQQRVKQAGEHIEIVKETDNQNRGATFARMADWPLAVLQRRQDIEPAEFQAGERYYEDWYKSGLCPQTSVDYTQDKVDTSGVTTSMEFRADALDSFLKAARVNGHLISPVVDAICLHGDRIAEVQGHPNMRRNSRDRQAQVIWTLRIGLDNLAVHYGYKR